MFLCKKTVFSIEKFTFIFRKMQPEPEPVQSREPESGQGIPDWLQYRMHRRNEMSKTAYIVVGALGLFFGVGFFATGIGMTVYTTTVCPGSGCNDLPDWC